jgi:hypothetical protein
LDLWVIARRNPFTAEDPFDFAQGRLFAKFRTGSEDAEEYERSRTSLSG